MKQVEFHRPVTKKGTVTIPAEVRRLLGVKPRDRVRFRIVGGKRVELLPPTMTLESAFSSVTPKSRPLDFKKVREEVREEKARQTVAKMRP